MNHKIRFLVLVILLFLFWYMGKIFHIDLESLQNYLSKFPLIWAGFIFTFLYCIVSFFTWFSWVTKDILRFVAAVLFGAYVSTLFIWIAETLNSSLLFYLTRFLGRGFVERFLQKKYQNFDERIGRVNFFWLFLFRFVPLVPFAFLDLANGLSKIPFRRYFWAIVLGSPLRIFWLQYILSAVGLSVFKDPSILVSYLLANKSIFIFSFIYLILVIIVGIKIKSKF